MDKKINRMEQTQNRHIYQQDHLGKEALDFK
jgi:hypothetical protein